MSLDDFVAVPITTDLYVRLVQRFPGGVSTLIEDVVTDFLERTADDVPMPRRAGVRWEGLFLLSGTLARTHYYGEEKRAEVVGTEIIWEGETYPSFANLANAMRGDTKNNAWKVLELKRPNDPHWQPAYLLRHTT
ncbi:hypothetical protein M3I54_42070 [Paraburkholderia sp. CNPSo 3274]|uniref:hypothetical protein n=1 Tax=Paraburkholderia sp. CNPSo 3274 TaxID=2940932 RepID=UPI0020B821DE|nr:hypothetical protein [Paraburkholderia sp. CNPSo 3274]MCP3713368.1 hypothetical protein [Paraburkholderia sp. CNPSo 3274]